MAFKRPAKRPAKYGPAHVAYTKQLKAQLAEQGYLVCTAPVCVMQTRLITNPNGLDRDGLHAGHNPDGQTYAGPQHNVCNMTEAAVRGRRIQDTAQSTLDW